MKKIAFFTEINFNGKFPENSVGRTDVNWFVTLNATHINVNNIQSNERFDYGIYIIPKKNPKLDGETFLAMKAICNEVGVMQEANHENYQLYSVDEQIQYIHFLDNCDFLLCHNEIDLKYYKGLFPDKPVNILPTLMLTDQLDKTKITPDFKRSGTMIGGTLCQWYSGMDSFMIAQELEEPLFAPSMGRKQEYEDYIEDIKYLPYKDWNGWMYDLSFVKYAVHLMRTTAAGSFSLNCAFLKIPCIGWNKIDTQRLLFPELSFDEGDMVSARKAAKHLKTNELFHRHVVEYAYKQYQDLYHPTKFLESTNAIFI